MDLTDVVLYRWRPAELATCQALNLDKAHPKQLVVTAVQDEKPGFRAIGLTLLSK